MNERQIIYNAIETPDGTLLVSRHRHDYVAHTDTITGEYFGVDGGLDYIRYIGPVIEKCKMITHYLDEGHEVAREFMAWGTYGVSGKEPLHYIKIKDMSNDHIESVFDYLEDRGKSLFKQVLLTEIEYRELKNKK